MQRQLTSDDPRSPEIRALSDEEVDCLYDVGFFAKWPTLAMHRSMLLLPELLDLLRCDGRELERLREEEHFPSPVPVKNGAVTAERWWLCHGDVAEGGYWASWARDDVRYWLDRFGARVRRRRPDRRAAGYDRATLQRWRQLGCGRPYAVAWPGELGQPCREDDRAAGLTLPDVAELVGEGLVGVAYLVRHQELPAPCLTPERDGEETFQPRWYADDVAAWLAGHPERVRGDLAGAPASGRRAGR